MLYIVYIIILFTCGDASASLDIDTITFCDGADERSLNRPQSSFVNCSFSAQLILYYNFTIYSINTITHSFTLSKLEKKKKKKTEKKKGCRLVEWDFISEIQYMTTKTNIYNI